MPDLALALGTGLVGTGVKPYRLFVNGEDILTGTGGVPLDTLEWSHSGTSGPADLSAEHWDPPRAFTIAGHAEVRLWDQALDEDLFGGYLTGREFNPAFATGRVAKLRAIDYSIELDRNLVTKISYPAGLSDRAIVQGLLGNFLRGTLVNSAAYIAETNTSMPAMEFEMQSLRAALEQVATLANGDGLGQRFVWVDPKYRAVRYARVRPSAAPYTITDGPAGGSDRAVTDLTMTEDDSAIVTAVYVNGSPDAPQGSGWVIHNANVLRYGWRADTLNVPDSNTRAKRDAYGQSFLAARSTPIRRGTFSITGTTGWRADQAVTITSTALGMAAEVFDIKNVRVSVVSGTPTFRHDIDFGALRPGLFRSGAAVIRRTAGEGSSIGRLRL
jgi:hypothetical protein